MRAEEDRLFAEFRASRDPRLLAEVFDRTAFELLRVALHVSRDVPSAEDLVQATFLAAIEGAQRWRDDVPLLPWLLGILTNLARAARKRERRRVAPGHAQEHAPDASFGAVTSELREALASALRGLPSPYREILEMRLERGWSTGAIALALRRPPGTVRAQIWRACEMLRKALPRGHHAPVLLLLETRGLDALRSNVLNALPAAGTSAAIAWYGGGMLLAKKLLIGVAVIAAAGSGVVIWSSRAETEAPPTQPAVPHAALAASDGGGGARLERQALPGAATDASAVDETRPARTAPYALRLRVVDAQGQAVAGARVEIREARRVRSGPGRAGIQVSEDDFEFITPLCDAPMIMNALTAADGRCTVVLEREACYAAVAKPGAGHTLEPLRPPVVPGSERVVKLQPWFVVEGVALRAGAEPAGNVEVRATPVRYWLLAGCEPVAADRDGRFRLELADGTFRIEARDGALRSHAVEVEVNRGAVPTVRLYFPGTLVVHGFLLAPSGKPCAGAVRALAPRGLRASATAGANGAFTLDLPQPGNWELIGMAAGQSHSEATRIEAGGASPLPLVNLWLTSPTTVRGEVLDSHEMPIAGAAVSLEPASAGASEAELRYGSVTPTTASPAGTFELAGVHPAASWTLVCTPDPNRPRLALRVRDVRGGQNVRVVVPADALRSARVSGVVVDDRGLPVPSYELRVDTRVDAEGGTRALQPAVDAGKPVTIRDERGAFAVDGLAFGRTYTLFFEAKGYARASFGPWTADAESRTPTVRLERFGSLRVRVVDDAGEPLARAECLLTSKDPRLPLLLHLGGDDKGVITAAKVTPARYTLSALDGRGRRAAGVAATQEIDVTPGARTDVELRLPSR